MQKISFSNKGIVKIANDKPVDKNKAILSMFKSVDEKALNASLVKKPKETEHQFQARKNKLRKELAAKREATNGLIRFSSLGLAGAGIIANMKAIVAAQKFNEKRTNLDPDLRTAMAQWRDGNKEEAQRIADEIRKEIPEMKKLNKQFRFNARLSMPLFLSSLPVGVVISILRERSARKALLAKMTAEEKENLYEFLYQDSK